MGYTCIEIRNYASIKVLCLIVYFITGIIVKNFFIIFSNFNSQGKKTIRKFPKLKSVPDFEIVSTNMSAIILTNKNMGSSFLFFQK